MDPQFHSPKYCGNCGKEILQNATFCAYCGEKVPQIDSQGSIKPQMPYSDSRTVSAIPYDARGGYPYQYQDRKEAPLPFFQHFSGVITAPQREMPEIVKRPNLKQPIILIVIAGLIAGFASYLLFTKVEITFTTAYLESLGMPVGTIDEEAFGEVMSFSFILAAFLAPIGFLTDWIFSSLILWGLMALISSNIPSFQRNFKTAATIVGWTYIPSIVEEFFNLVYYIFFVEPMTLTVNSNADLAVIDSIGATGEIGLVFMILGLIFHLWGVILVYFAAKGIDDQGSHAVLIAIIYGIIPYAFTLISLFTASSLL